MKLLLNFSNCVRCGGEHKALECRPLTGQSSGWSHFTMCPVASQPIMVKVGGGDHRPAVKAMQVSEFGDISKIKSIPPSVSDAEFRAIVLRIIG